MKKTLLFALVPFLSGCGLLFVNGPPSGWQEIQDPDQLETMAITQPCTGNAGYGVLLVDLMPGAFFGLGAIAGLPDTTGKEKVQSQVMFALLATPYLAGAVMGVKKVSDCKAFNARLFELHEGRTSSLTSYEWLDEFFPLPDLGVTGLDPVFGVPINQDH